VPLLYNFDHENFDKLKEFGSEISAVYKLEVLAELYH